MPETDTGKYSTRSYKVLETGDYVAESGLTQPLIGSGKLADLLKANKMDVHNLVR